ncbi:MAG: DUF6364 family protein [Ferruginibacter sp.]
MDTAKMYAKKRGKSLSHLVENYLKSIITVEKDDIIISPKVLKLQGIIKLPVAFDYKTDLAKALAKKYQK